MFCLVEIIGLVIDLKNKMSRRHVWQFLWSLLLMGSVGLFYWTCTKTKLQFHLQFSKKNSINFSVRNLPYMSPKWNIARDRSMAEKMEGEIRVLCWITMYGKTLGQARLVRDTWGKRCTKFLLIGDRSTRRSKGIVSLNVPSGRKYLWVKTKAAFKYIAENHLNDADWFFKADTDTYVIMENLRFYLSELDVNQPHYIGAKINETKISQDFMSGGAGYVLNRISLKKLVKEGYKIDKCQRGYRQFEDVSIGICMQLLNVTFDDSMDCRDRHRFLPLHPYDHMGNGPLNTWYYKSAYKPKAKNMSCCSEFFISFHYVSPEVYWAMEFALYHAHVFGVIDTYT